MADLAAARRLADGLEAAPPADWAPLLAALSRLAASPQAPAAQPRPVRPWERQAAQQQQPAEQQPAAAADDVRAALARALDAVAGALQRGDVAAAPQLLGPALGFVGAALPALAAAGPAAAERRRRAVAAACSALGRPAAGAAPAAPALQLLAACAEGACPLLAACAEQPDELCWLLAAVLGALRAGLPSALAEPSEAPELAGAQAAGALAGLAALGQRWGRAACRSAAAAGAPDAGALRGLAAGAALLLNACSEGDALLAALAGAVAAGAASGSLEALTPLPAAEDVWAAAAGAAPPLQPLWRQHVEQQALLLARALSVACARCAQDDGAAPDDAAGWCARLLAGGAFARLASAHGAALDALEQWPRPLQQPAPSLAGLLCGLSYVLHQGCGLAGALFHAGVRGDAGAASAWLAAQQREHGPHAVGALARWLAGAAARLPDDEQRALLGALRREAEARAEAYAAYLAAAPAAVVQRVDAAALRQQLDRGFALHVALLAALWGACERRPGAAGGVARAAVAAQGLAGLGALQFCSVHLPACAELLRGLVGAVAGDAEAADAFLGAALPEYCALTRELHAPGEAGGPAGERAWMASPVLVARLAFLLPLVPVACGAARDPAGAAARVLPLVLLLLPHGVPHVAQAAHAAFAGLWAAAAAPAVAAAPAQAALRGVLRQAVPLYLQRSLQYLPSVGSLEGFAIGSVCLLRELPPRDPMALLVVRRTAARAVELAWEDAAQQGPAAAAAAAPAAAAASLVEQVALALQALDFGQLPAALDAVAAAVLAAPSPARPAWLAALYRGSLSDDYARRPLLVAWIDGLAKRVTAAQQRLHQEEQPADGGSGGAALTA
ncbi:hypothetical protein HT031_004340 [Scenedesmus sp. PABB004]|nr:hypothetical protein HT031_004340 [Scenedesmus sp. PABB004]